MKLTEKHFEIMKDVEGGATVFGYVDAKLLREVQRYDRDLLTIIDDISELEYIENKVYDGASQLPYFGVILTQKGKEFLEQQK